MTITQIIGLVVVVLFSAFCGYSIIKKSKKNDLFKWILLFIFVALSLTWIFNGGQFSGAELKDSGVNKIGLTDLPNVVYYAMNFAGDKIVYLLALGCFYAVLSKVNGYKKLVHDLAEKLKGKEVVVALASSLIFAAFGAMLTQTFVALLFVPFVISVLANMKFDKMSMFSVTFGSILIGLMGTVYGSEGLSWFNYYTGLDGSGSLIYRLFILVVAFILFNLFNVMHVKKTLSEKANLEKDVDPFKLEKFENGSKTWPVVTILAVMLVLVILGFVGWSNFFETTIFSEYHAWLLKLDLVYIAKIAMVLIGLNLAMLLVVNLTKMSKKKVTITLGGILVLVAILVGIAYVNLDFLSGYNNWVTGLSLNEISIGIFGYLTLALTGYSATEFKLDKKKMIVTGGVALGLVILLALVAWVFTDWAKELTVISYVLGGVAKNAVFGSWDLFIVTGLLIAASIITAFVGRVNVNEFIESAKEGFGAMSKGIILYVLVYMLLIIIYMSPVMATITNLLATKNFNPFTTALTAIISNTFHIDLGFTGFAVGTYFVNAYASSTTMFHLIFTSLYGFVQMFAPTGGLLLIGLSYLNIEYKSWIKYVWIFALGMLAILLVLFTVLTYI